MRVYTVIRTNFDFSVDVFQTTSVGEVLRKHTEWGHGDDKPYGLTMSEFDPSTNSMVDTVKVI